MLPLLPDIRVRQRDYLLEIGRALTQELDLEKLLTRILSLAAEMLAGQAGLIVLRSEEEEGKWSVAVSHGIPTAFLNYLGPLLASIPRHDDPTRFGLPALDTLDMSSTSSTINRLLQDITYIASFGMLGSVGLPLIVHGQVIGVIFIFRNYTAHFSANDQALLQSFADQAAIAVRNAKLYTQVRREKQRLDTLLDSAADGILILTTERDRKSVV